MRSIPFDVLESLFLSFRWCDLEYDVEVRAARDRVDVLDDVLVPQLAQQLELRAHRREPAAGGGGVVAGVVVARRRRRGRRRASSAAAAAALLVVREREPLDGDERAVVEPPCLVDLAQGDAYTHAATIQW